MRTSGSSSGMPLNRDFCPSRRLRRTRAPTFIAVGSSAICWARCPGRASKQPAFIRASSAPLLTSWWSTRSQKSNRFSNGPPSSRASTMQATAFEPAFLTAPRPNRRRSSPIGVNSARLSLISGGSTSMPSCRHSSIRATTLSVSPISQEMLAAMNSVGKWAFR